MLVDLSHFEVGLKSLPLFDRLIASCDGREAYVVGGAIRDALIGQTVQDIDLISPEDPTALAKSFAAANGGHWFWLDEERRQGRVVFGRDKMSPVFDFSPFRASSLDQDLIDRDFTINAIALSLSSDLSATSLIDPVSGLADLRQDLLRMVSRDAFTNDPLRIVKGVRHATALRLQIEDKTLDCMQAWITGLYRVAPERIRQEIWKILASEDASRGLHLLSQSMAGNYLFGNDFENKYHDLSEALVVARNSWRNLALKQPVIRNWLVREVEQGLTFETLLLWSLLLSRLHRDLAGRLADEWLLSRKAQAYVKALSSIDVETLKELDKVSQECRAFAWWAHAYSIEPKLWLLALAAIDALNEHVHSDLICSWVPLVDTLDGQSPQELVDGHWLQHVLGLPAGPEMSRALQLLRNAEIFGRVDNSENAREYLLNHYKNID